jgi:SAM-dependent methyltransferase
VDSAQFSFLAIDRLLPILRCPETGQRLRKGQGEYLSTENGGRTWPVVAGRPVFLPATAELVVYPETHLSNAVGADVVRVIEEAQGLVLQLSAGGTARRFSNVIECEYAIFRHTDVVGDAHNLPFLENVFAAVISLNAFEHYREPVRAMSEIRRVLQPGGKLFLHTAFLQPLHEAPHHYFNCTKFGLKQWLRDFDIERIGVSWNFNPIFALAWLISELDHGFAALSPELVERFRNIPLTDLATFWREPSNRTELMDLFLRLPQPVCEATAGGWEAIAYKKGMNT